MDAMQAARLSGENDGAEIEKIIARIVMAAREGLYHLEVPGRIEHERTRQELRRLGYKLQKKGVYEQVSWEHNKPKH
jgi:hypothetical protein